MSSREKKSMWVGWVAVFALLLLFSGNSQAIPITYSCTAGADCNGNAYAVWVKSHVGDTYQLELDIEVLNTYTGNHWTDVVDAVALKNFNTGSYSNFSLVSAPVGVSNWDLSQKELTANGLTGGNSGGLGAESKEPGYWGAPLLGPGTVLSWVFQFDTTSPLNNTAHIKYLYETSGDNKIGSLGSWDIPTTSVPEPTTLLLLGSGLIGLVALGRKRRT